MKPTTRKHAKVINSGTLTENQITALVSYLNRLVWQHDDEDLAYLNDLLEAKAPLRITDAQTEKGITYLRNLATKRKHPFNAHHLHVLANFSHFLFMGVRPNPSYNRVQYTRVYRVVATSGEAFQYLNAPMHEHSVMLDWQPLHT